MKSKLLPSPLPKACSTVWALLNPATAGETAVSLLRPRMTLLMVVKFSGVSGVKALLSCWALAADTPLLKPLLPMAVASLSSTPLLSSSWVLIPDTAVVTSSGLALYCDAAMPSKACM